MSRNFWTKVRKFFSLLDVNRNGTIEPAEARQRLTKVFMETHQQHTEHHLVVDEVDGKDGLFGEDALKTEVDQKVQALFDAADFNHDQHITFENFEQMYKNLLKAYYEPEVLELDLDRAIAILEKEESSRNDSSMAPPPVPKGSSGSPGSTSSEASSTSSSASSSAAASPLSKKA